MRILPPAQLRQCSRSTALPAVDDIPDLTGCARTLVTLQQWRDDIDALYRARRQRSSACVASVKTFR
jgi:hypothetical protein